MKPEEQRIAIAEACGMYPEHWHETGVRSRCDYLNDLNAMHEAEKFLLGLNCDLHESYEKHLTNISGGLPWLASASQRAEAFLKTKGLWK